MTIFSSSTFPFKCEKAGHKAECNYLQLKKSFRKRDKMLKNIQNSFYGSRTLKKVCSEIPSFIPQLLHCK
jgi:hypothetical protein